MNRAFALKLIEESRKAKKKDLWQSMLDGAFIAIQFCALLLGTQVGWSPWLTFWSAAFMAWSIVSFRARLRRVDKAYDSVVARARGGENAVHTEDVQ